MATYTGTGQIQNIDGSAVASGSISVRLLNRIVSGGILKTAFAATYTTDGSGNYTLSSLPVPDDATKAAVYGIKFPDGRPEQRGAFSSGSSSDVETALAATAASTSANALDDYLLLAGGTMTGALTLSGAPTVDLHAATKKYVDDNAVSGLASTDIDTLAELNAIVTDATLIDTGDSRLSDARTPTAHASNHTDGTDDIQDATALQKGLATAAQITKLDGIETAATADQTGAEIKALYEAEANTNAFTDAEQTKLAGIEAGADVTDTANVTSAGALMDSEVDADIKTLSLPANTTISAFGATLVDDADASAARTTLGVDAAGTDNSTNVTLTGTGTYLSIAGQAITVDPITESDISDLGSYITAASTDTLTNKTFDANGTGNSLSNVETADIASGSKSGSDATLVTGTAGTNGNLAKWDANGDIVDGATESKVTTETLIIAVSDETTDLTTGTAKVTFRMPYAMTLTDIRASVTTAPTGSTVTVDVNEGGVSILSTKLTIDATEKTSETAATAAVISDSSLADDAEMTIDIDAIGSTTAGKGLKVYLIGNIT